MSLPTPPRREPFIEGEDHQQNNRATIPLPAPIRRLVVSIAMLRVMFENHGVIGTFAK